MENVLGTDKPYVRPITFYVGPDHVTGLRLYELERKTHEAVAAQALERAKAGDHDDPNNFWGAALPQALYDLLNGYSQDCARIVCEAWLQDHPVR